MPVATVVGVLAAVVQFLGLARWPFLVPALARAYTDPASIQAARETTTIVFDSFHRYLGIGVGECLGYLLTGTWTILLGAAMLQSSMFEAWLAWPGIVIGLFLIAGSLEFVGRSEEQGWRFAGVIVPITYVAWSLWLILSGVVLLVALTAAVSPRFGGPPRGGWLLRGTRAMPSQPGRRRAGEPGSESIQPTAR